MQARQVFCSCPGFGIWLQIIVPFDTSTTAIFVPQNHNGFPAPASKKPPFGVVSYGPFSPIPSIRLSVFIWGRWAMSPSPSLIPSCFFWNLHFLQCHRRKGHFIPSCHRPIVPSSHRPIVPSSFNALTDECGALQTELKQQAYSKVEACTALIVHSSPIILGAPLKAPHSSS